MTNLPSNKSDHSTSEHDLFICRDIRAKWINDGGRLSETRSIGSPKLTVAQVAKLADQIGEK